MEKERVKQNLHRNSISHSNGLMVPFINRCAWRLLPLGDRGNAPSLFANFK